MLTRMYTSHTLPLVPKTQVQSPIQHLRNDTASVHRVIIGIKLNLREFILKNLALANKIDFNRLRLFGRLDSCLIFT